MSAAILDVRMRRVRVAVEAVGSPREVLAAAVTLAARLGLEVHAMLVEEENLLRVVRLPVARHLSLGGRRTNAPAPETMIREIELLAIRARRVLERLAASSGVRWSWESTKSPFGSEPGETETGELLVVRHRGRERFGLPSRLVKEAFVHEGPVALFPRGGEPLRAPLALVSAEARNALGMALCLSSDERAPLLVGVVGSDPESRRELRRELADSLNARGRVARFASLPDMGTNAIAIALGTLHADALILPRPLVPDARAFTRRLLNEWGVPVVLVE